jgi:four helix bundle protein
MTATDLRDRTKAFALRIIALYRALPRTQESRVLANQLLRAGTSVGANYREAVRSRSNAEYISKLGVVLQELDETRYWLELLTESGIVPAKRLWALTAETDELLAICVTLSKKAGSSPRHSS